MATKKPARSPRREPPKASALAPTEPEAPVSAPTLPFVLRGLGVRIDETLKAYVARRVRSRLGRYSLQLDRVAVRLQRVSAPQGATTYVCRFTVDVPSAEKVSVEAADEAARAAFDAAIDAVDRAVRRLVDRRTTRKTGLRAAR